MVAERVPVLLWQTAHGTYSVDGQGMVIAPAAETPGADRLLTVVDTGARGPVIHPGMRLDATDIAFAAAVFKRLPELTGLTSFKLRYDSTIYTGVATPQGGNGSYVVASNQGWLAYLGSANNANPLDNRLIELQKILAMAQQQQLSLATIDVRYGLRPVYTLKQ
jgi:cell division septal protein FtsQ